MLLAAFGVLALLPAAAADWPVPSNKGFATVKELLAARCSGCHGWTQSYERTAIPGRVTPGKPDESRLFVKVATGAMPPLGRRLGREEVGLIRAWIAAGAPSTDTPLDAPAVDATAGSSPAAADAQPSPADATAAASPSGEAESTAAPSAPSAPAGQGLKKLSPFEMKVRYHEISGFTSGGLLLASGIVGGLHILNMREAAHDIRDAYDLEEESAACRAAMADAWRGDAALRWVHVGLLGAGVVGKAGARG